MDGTFETATHFLTGRQFLCHPLKALDVAESIKDRGDSDGSALKRNSMLTS